MKNKFSFIKILGIAAIVFFIGCGFFYAITHLYTAIYGNKPRCSTPIGDFSQANLIGTWIAGVPDHMDKLLIRANGTYKQIIHVKLAEASPIDYESGWQSWRLDYSSDHIPYLHLAGMRFCGMNPAISCETLIGDGYDICQDKSITMDNEGILIVLETSEEKPGDLTPQYFYYLHYPLGTDNSWVYILQEP